MINSISQIVLLELKDAFSFDSHRSPKIQDAILINYYELLQNKLDIFLNKLKNVDTSKHNILNQKYNSRTSDEKKIFLKLPEIAHRIISYNSSNLLNIAIFFLKAIDAEIARMTNSYEQDNYEHLWTAGGSFYIKYDHSKLNFSVFETFHILDNIPVDFLSPYNLKITNNDLNESPDSLINIYELNEIEGLCDKLEYAVNPIHDLSNIINQLRNFISVVVINRITINGNPTSFYSGSDALYPCRVIISNIAKAKPEAIIESLIHESIHSALYMTDLCNPWLPDSNKRKEFNYNVQSPWTGNKISLANIIEAVFVWYGVYKFWRMAEKENLYDPEIRKKRLIFLKNGFSSLNIKDIFHKYDFNNENSLVTVISLLRTDVLSKEMT
ncbi:hypothetical protein [Pedobacter cryoconitis]|uniref:HEXXH motif-containing protein n=1 Tax=Pedobacter cryoconitis TaxID=188932 RepID=A0A327SF58_9SPHI|nr:hypothetical protein [Pedobacter cryoconitis]RAJ27215.1 hypothetical protein LY11_03505 [Pedobacter cryoconitis]